MTKFLLLTSIILFIFVLYYSFGTEPDIVFFEVCGWKCGLNYTSNVYLKLMAFATLGMYLMIRYERDNSV
jgi:hypothetical protein